MTNLDGALGGLEGNLSGLVVGGLESNLSTVEKNVAGVKGSPALLQVARAALLVARGDAESRDDLGLMGLGMRHVGAGAAAEPAGGFVVADEDAGVVVAVGILHPDLVALLEALFDRLAHGGESNRCAQQGRIRASFWR